MKKRLTFAVAVFAAALGAFAQASQPETSYADDFQSYGTPKNPPGWVDTSIGSSTPVAGGLFKTWPDPLQGNKATNIVYGTKSSSGKADASGRMGIFSTLTTKNFAGKGRFEYRGRFLRSDLNGRVGMTFFSSYPEKDSYYLIGLWPQGTTTTLTMRLMAFGTAAPTGTIDSNFTPENNKWYQFVVQVDDADNTTSIRARFWPDGTTEPKTFSIDAKDASSTRLTSGRIGIWSAGGDSYFDDITAKSPVDHTPPVVKFLDADTQKVLDPAQLALFKQPARVDVQVTDDLSTTSYTAQLDGNAWTALTPIATDGTHSITVHAVDGPGNATDATLNLLVDQVPPQLVLQANGATFTNGTVFDKDVTVTATVTDISKTTTTAKLDGTTIALPASTAEEKLHEISVTAVDQVGWTTTATQNFYVDKTAPVISIKAGGQELADGASFQSDVAISFSATDLTLDTITATLDGNPFTSGTVVSAEAIHTIVVTATDKAHHTSTETRKFVLDKSAPAVTLFANGQPFVAGTAFGGPVTFTTEVHDATPVTQVATLDNHSYTLGTSITGEGAHTIKVVATNAAGLSTTVGPFPFTIDVTKPVVTLTESGNPLTDGMKFNRDVNPVVTATDNLTASPDRVLLVDGKPFPLDTPISEEKRDHTIAATATDAAGNSQSVGPFHFMLDKTKPVVTIADGDGKAVATDALFNHPVIVKVKVVDLTNVTLAATLNNQPFTFDGGVKQSDGSVLFTSNAITNDGVHYVVSVVATDEVGNKSDAATATFSIDQTAPHLTFTAPPDGVTVSTPTILVQGTSDDAQTVTVNGLTALVDLTAKTFAVTGVPLLEGRNAIVATGIDKAGNSGSATLVVNLDTRAPDLAISAPSANACMNASSITVTGRMSDLNAHDVKVSITPGSVAPVDVTPASDGTFTATIAAPGEGKFVITVEAADAVGHVTSGSVPVVIDRTAPSIVVSNNGMPFTGGFVNHPPSLFIRANDADPSATLTVTLNGQPFVSGSTVSTDGSYTLKATARDCAGNASPETSIAFSVDTVAPRIVSLDPADGATITTAQKTIAGSFDSADVKSLTIDGTSFAATISGATFTLPSVTLSEGTNRFVLTATDNAGNQSRTSYSFNVKTTTPSVTISENGSPITANAIFNRPVTPSITSNEPAAMITAALDGAAFTSGTAISAEGAHTLHATASDAYGHTSAQASATFTIDRTPPVVAITSPSDSSSTTTDHVDVRGTASGGDIATVTVNGATATVASDGSFTLTNVALDLGPNTILVAATDRAGNAGTASVTITRSDKLGIVLTSPADKTLTNRHTITVAGQLLTATSASTVSINGVGVPVDVNGLFTKSDFALTEGTNTITATVRNAAGTANSASLTVTADFTPPVLNVLADGADLQNNARFATSPTITLQTSDNRTDPITTKLTLDGSSATAPVSGLTDGGHALTAIARDAAGNESRIDRTFAIGAGTSTGGGCSLTSFDPANNSSVYSDTIKISGRSGGASNVRVNNVRAQIADGSFAAAVTLQVGRNDIHIQCADSNGNATTDAPATLTLYRYTDATITITSPANDSVASSASITVSGTVNDGVVTGDVNTLTFSPANGTYSVSNVPLVNGLNIITANAKTSSSRIGTASVRVKYFGGAPQISITSPLPGTQTGATSIDVTGTYVNVDPSTIALSTGTQVQFTAQSDTTGIFVATGVVLAPNAKTTITVTGRSRTNATATASTDVTTSGNAAISITTPLDNAALMSATKSVHVAGTFAPIAGSQVSVNGVVATLDVNGNFAADLDLTTATTTSIPIVARVTTADGQSATDAVRLIRFTAPLSVLDSFPSQNAVEVASGVLIVVRFSNSIDASSVTPALKLVDASNGVVDGETFVDNEIVSFAPIAPLTAGMHYTFTVSQTLKDLAGGTLASPYSLPFTVAVTAPATPPVVDQQDASGCFTNTTITGTATIPGARVRLDVDGVTMQTSSDATTGKFSFGFTFSGQPGFHIARVRQIASDGTLSAEKDVTYQINCAGPQVVASSLDRAAKKVTINFSKPMKLTSLVASPTGTIVINGFTGTVALNANGDVATVTLTDDVSTAVVTLTVRKTVEDTTGGNMAADYTQTFTLSADQPTGGYVTGAVYDATNGRPLAGASVDILNSQSAILNSSSDDHGRYTRAVDEGVYTIQASAPGYTTVWRQIVVPSGSGVVPIDIRLTKRGPQVTSTGAAIQHGADTTVTKKVELTAPVGATLTLTSVGAQSLAGLLPLGWSPVAAAEIVLSPQSSVLNPLPGGKLTFDLSANDVAAITASTQTLSLVQYDNDRDEWRVVSAVANVGSDGRVPFDITTSGNYALVYPDKAPNLAHPSPARSGAPLAGVSNPCTNTPDVCRMTSKSFDFTPKSVLPSGRAVANLVTDGVANSYPSGTAVQAFIDEQLNLADGRVVIDPPFATDLLIYRNFAGDSGVADFHLSPTTQAAALTLRDGNDHIRVVDYPGRIDRGALIGSEGGRVPGDDGITIDIPTGATAEPLHASAASITDLSQFAPIPGFHIAGAFTFSLSRATDPTPIDADGDGQPDPVAPPSLLKPATAIFTIPPTTSQVVIAELLPNTAFGAGARLATQTQRVTDTRYTSVLSPQSSFLPVDGIVRDGRYLILTADNPIAFAKGKVVNGGTALAVAGARVITSTLGIFDITRIGGIFAIPVVAKPAAPFTLTPRSTAIGDGDTYTAAASPDADAIVDAGTLTLSAHPPQLTSLTPANGSVKNAGDPFVVTATFDKAIDAASLTNAITVVNLNDSTTVAGSISGASNTVTFTGAAKLNAGTRYSIAVASTIRATNGAAYGRTTISTFSTPALPVGDNTIHPELIHITIPDANGVSIISGKPGALPAGAQAVAVRRGNFFVTQYQTTVGADKSFTFNAGGAGTDRITTSDLIDLQVIDSVSRAIIAVIPLTPFVTADGTGFIAPVTDHDIRFTNPDGISLIVPAGAFSEPTLIHVTSSDKQALAAVPSFDHDLAFAAGTRVDFDGIANKRLQLEIPVPAGFQVPDHELMLGWLGESVRGPRIMAVDTIRIADGKFMTADDGTSSAQSHRATTKSVLLGRDVKQYLLGVLRSGIYSVVNIQVPSASGWAIFDGLQKGYDLFWDTLGSLYASDFYLTEGRGRVAIPVLVNTPMKVEGVDSGTGFKAFEKQYPNADGGVLENPNPDLTGPYPVFATPSAIQQVDVVDDDLSVRNFHLKLVGTNLTIDWNSSEPAALRLPEGAKVQALNTANGESTNPTAVLSDGSFSLGTITAHRGDRIILMAGVADIAADTDMSVVFNEPIALTSTTVLSSILNLSAYSGTTKIDVTDQLKVDVDSSGRRLNFAMPSGQLIRGARYELTLKQAITDLAGNPLGRGVTVIGGVAQPTGGNRDFVLSFRIRDRAPSFGDFQIDPFGATFNGGSVRDLAQYGSILFVSALDGGILAYDLADPASLKPSATGAQPKPLAVVPARWTNAAGSVITPGFDEHWAVATDHHGRVYSTGFMSNFGVIRSYRVEDFLAASNGTPSCAGSPDAPANALCTFHGSTIIGWRPGYSSSLDLPSGTLLSDRPEATPRKLQILIQDDEEDYATVADFKAAYTTSPDAIYPDDFEKLKVTLKYIPNSDQKYLSQRMTVENVTRDMRWSIDVAANQTLQLSGVIARKGDHIKVYRNERTYGLITQFGYGVSVFDLNAVESNDAPNRPASYTAIREQIIATTGDAASSCTALVLPPTGAITDLTFSPEAVVVPTSDPTRLVAFASEVHNGVLGFGVPLGFETQASGTTSECIVRDTGMLPINDPRVAPIKQAFTNAGRTLRPRYGSMSYFRGELAGQALDYVLVAGGDLGLLAYNVGPEASPYLSNDLLAGIIWVPQGVVAVRTIPGSHLATIVDGVGRVLIVDLTGIDERYDSSGNVTTGLFKTTAIALNPPLPTPGQIGVDDPRIVWKSDPGFMANTLPPLVDPDTGMLVSGDVTSKTMRAVPAFDPTIKMMIETGSGLKPVDGITPLGIAPRANFIDATQPDASSAAFRLQVSLPAGAAKALDDAGRALQLAVESEFGPNVVTAQTPLSYPKAHLRSNARDGSADSRPTKLILHRDLPSALENEVRYQKGAVHYISDWIVPIADPRASEKWKWLGTSVDKAAAGCANCDRPARLKGKAESDNVYELWTAGRYISVRPDGDFTSNILVGTSYDYLGRNGRMQARFTTIRARKVRPTEVLVPAHNPPVADGMLQETHYVHSGEVETASTDLDAGGRGGVNVVIARTYRSRTIGGTELGEGWDSPLFRFVLPLPNGDVEYHDGGGEICTFKVNTSTGALDSPKGLFLKLLHTQRGYTMLDQKWRIAEFNDLGQLVSESDEFYDPSDSDSGNIVRYIYDELGKLTRVVDPLGRATKLTYDNDRLSEVDTDWRHRSVKYHYDTFGRLTSVDLPETKAAPGLPPTYDHTGTSRPVVEYTYQTVTPPQATEPLQSQTYTDFAEFGGDLATIKNPEQEKLGGAGQARVTFTYDLSTDTTKRDRNLTQTWASGDTATFDPNSNSYVDVLGQHRSYTLTPAGSFDGRRHILSKRVLDVPLMDAAASGLPDAISPLLTTTNHAQLETRFDYNDQGMATTTTLPNGLVESDTWVAANGAPGMVLSNKKETAPGGGLIETDYGFDPAANATANLNKVGRRDSPTGSFIYRDQQTPSRSRPTIENNDVSVKTKGTFSKHGQVEHVQTGDSSGSSSMESQIEYYEPSTTNPIESGRPKHITRGGGTISHSSTYGLSSGGEETEITRDDIRGVVTTIVKDADGRMISRKVVAPSASTTAAVAPSLTEETFGYNADGQLAYQSRLQSGVPGGSVITTTTFDALGREIGTETTNAKVLIDPTVAGGDSFVSLKTKKTYNLAARQITDFDPFRVDETAAPRTVTTLDGLGRTGATERKSASGTLSVKTITAYDITGKKAYESDLTRIASLMQNDGFGRPIASIATDGTRTDAAYDVWDEVVESHGYAKKAGAAPPEMTAHNRNVYTADGRLQLTVDQIDTAGSSRGSGTSWQLGDAVTTQRVGELAFTDPAFGATTNVRVMQTTRDAAGRVVSQIAGAATGPDALVDPSNTFVEDRVTDYVGDLAMKHELREPRAARKTESSTGYDGLGRPIVIIDGGGAYTSYANYDEAGNQTLAQSPGMQAVTMQYDSRGAMHLQTFSNGKTIQRVYDERSALRQYIDEEGHVTFTDVDDLGRPTAVRYPDGTFEQTMYENGTGVVSARRDRAGRWIWFKYDPNGGRLLEEHHGGNGPTPTFTDDPFIRYTYDDAGRLIRTASADAAVEYDEFDLLGRPQVTRSIRYKKTGCIPAAVTCGSGLTSSPQIAEVYTQGHEWSVFDGERTRWRLPAVGSTLPVNEVDSSWRNWIDEQRDGGANLIKQQEAVSRSGTASGPTLNASLGRGPGRLAQRQLGNVLTRFGYADSADATTSAIVPANPVAPGPATGGLGRAESVVGSHTIAGTEITLGAKKLIESAKDLGLAARSSSWSYDDDRAWLKHTVLLEHDGATANEPVVNTNVRDASLLDKREINPPRIGSTDMSLLSNANALVPLTWTADGINDANQMTHRSFSNGSVASGDQTFTWSGGRREDNGLWKLTYDDGGRVVAKDSSDRRIVYDYDPNDRIVGRICYQKDASGALTIENRPSVLSRDGLPAETTFVWDPITDRLVAMYDSAAVQTATTPVVETGLIRQYVHGEEGYDDPVEVLIASAPGLAPQHYVPILDEAGAGSLQAVVDDSGKLVERVLYADSFGDAPRYLQGAVADHITVGNAAGARTIAIHFTESVDATSIASGVRLAALDANGTTLRTASSAPVLSSDEHTLTWTVNLASWTTFTQGAQTVQIAVTSSLRFPAWGATPLQPVATWETTLGRATSSANDPLIKTAQLAEFDANATIYDVPDLYLVAYKDSIAKLLFDFHGLPFRDPADGLIFARARWYDPSSGSFISADPESYRDTSSLYAFAANDPVNHRDPNGESILDDAWDAAKFVGGIAVGAVEGAVKMAVGTVTGVFNAAYNSTGALLYATTGGEQYREQADSFARGFDAVKTIAHNPLVLVTAPIKHFSEEAEAAAANGDTFGVGRATGQTGFDLLSMFAGGEGEVGEIASEGKVLAEAESASRIEKEVRVAEEATEVSNEARQVAHAVEEEAPLARSMEPCPVGLCLLGSTPINTPLGLVPISQLRVGDRVSSTFVDSQHADGWTEVDSVNWHVVKMRMSNPQQEGDNYEIEMLRPVAWIVAHEAYPGRTIELATERNTRDRAYVISVAPAPKVAEGPGRVVLATYSHRDEVLTIRFANSAESIESSPWHRLYSSDRNEWVSAHELRVGERVRTKSGEAAIVAIAHESGTPSVVDIEVEGDHAYYVASHEVLTHNCGTATEFNIAPHGEQPTPRSPLESHHIIQDAWARNNMIGYNTRRAPSILLDDATHDVINDLQNARRDLRVLSGERKWGSTLRDEFEHAAADLRASGVPEKVRRSALKKAYKHFYEP